MTEKVNRFPSIEINTQSVNQTIYYLNGIFGEEHAVESVEHFDNGYTRIHFDQSLPMTPAIERFYEKMRELGTS